MLCYAMRCYAMLFVGTRQPKGKTRQDKTRQEKTPPACRYRRNRQKHKTCLKKSGRAAVVPRRGVNPPPNSLELDDGVSDHVPKFAKIYAIVCPNLLTGPLQPLRRFSFRVAHSVGPPKKHLFFCCFNFRFLFWSRASWDVLLGWPRAFWGVLVSQSDPGT